MPRIIKIVDLSHALTQDTPVYPGDPVPGFSVATTVQEDGYNVANVILGSQTGTHVDSPFHFSNQGVTIDRMDLRSFMGHGFIIDMTHKGRKEEFTLAEIQAYENQIAGVDIVVFRTDWYKKAGSPEFFDHPFLSIEGGEYLLSLGVKTVGVDAINLDNTGGTDFPIHDMFSAAGGIIAEDLAHLDRVNFPSPFLIFLPLKLTGCSGSPVRAAAIEFE